MKYFRLFAGFLLVFALFFAFNPVLQAQKTPNQILYNVSKKMNAVRDYSADADIKADIPAVRILPVKAKIYFKQKDKFKVESPGIVLLPKQGFNDFYKVIRDTNTYTAVLSGQDKIRQIPVQVINVIPAVDTADLILAKLWVDAANSLVLKSQLTTRSSGTMVIDYDYGTQKSYGLPDNLTFTVDVKKFKIPKGMATDLNKPSSAPDNNTGKKGQIYISLKNYKVNGGLSDTIFK